MEAGGMKAGGRGRRGGSRREGQEERREETECQVPAPLSPLPPAVVMVLLCRVPVRRSSPPLPWPSRVMYIARGTTWTSHHPKPTLPPHIHNSILCGVCMFVCKQLIMALKSFASPLCTSRGFILYIMLLIIASQLPPSVYTLQLALLLCICLIDKCTWSTAWGVWSIKPHRAASHWGSALGVYPSEPTHYSLSPLVDAQDESEGQ